MSKIDYEKRMPYLFKKGAKIGLSPKGIPYNENVPVFNRRMQLVIPTHLRPARQLTLKSLSKELRDEVLLITSTSQDRKELLRENKGLIRSEQVYAIDDPKVNSISKKRQWLIENLGSTSIFQLDDDQYFFARCARKYRHLIYDNSTIGEWALLPECVGKFVDGVEIKLLGKAACTEEVLTKAFRDIQDRMTRKENPYVHTGMSSRMKNHAQPKEWKIIGRVMHSIGHRRDILLNNNIRFDTVALREDFYVTLSLLTRGYPNCVLYTVCSSPADYGFKGGCTEERTDELNNDQAELLASKFPRFVKVENKAYTYSKPRKEVKVQWQQAYDSSKANDKASIF